jgi:Na+/melibiose symporter-like transporter
VFLKGSSLTLITMTPLYKEISKIKSGNECLGIVLLIAATVCLFSLLCAVILALMDLRRTRVIKQDPIRKASGKIKLSDALKFPATFWLLVLICATFYCAVFPFICLSKVFFISKYDFGPELAGRTTR